MEYIIYTPPKTNIEVESGPHFEEAFIYGFHVSFRGVVYLQMASGKHHN